MQNGQLFSIHMIPINKIDADLLKVQYKSGASALSSLADSISKYGILQPLSVRRLGEEKYELIAGRRRFFAARIAGLKELPCVIVTSGDRRDVEFALAESLRRQELDMFEQAGAISAIIDIYSLTQEQAAYKLSVSQSYIANKLRILRLGANEREIILNEGLTERHARSLLRIRDDIRRREVLEYVAEKHLNVASAEMYIDRIICEERAVLKQTDRKIIKEIRVFYNTVDRAVEVMREAGIEVNADRRDTEEEGENGIEMVISIPHAYRYP